MARREITQYFDDLDGTQLNTENLCTMRFSMEGTDYVIDLSEDNARDFHRVLEPYIHAAHTVTSTAKTTRKRIGTGSNARAIRQWAEDQGMTVSNRGKIPQAIVDAYDKAHAHLQSD